MSSLVMNSGRGPLESLLKKYEDEFIARNHAAKIVARGLSLVGVGLSPVLDHLVFKAMDGHQRAKEFLELGYVKDSSAVLLQPRNVHGEVYRKEGYPAILIQPAQHAQDREWLDKFGGSGPCALAVRVGDLEDAVFSLEKQGVAFLRPGAGHKGENLRQIAATPEMKDGIAATTFVLVERHAWDNHFYAPDFWKHA